MTKRSTNFSQWRKVGTAKDMADLCQALGITAEDLRKHMRAKAGTTRKQTVCPRCGLGIEVEVNNYDGSTVCPVCENDIIIA